MKIYMEVFLQTKNKIFEFKYCFRFWTDVRNLGIWMPTCFQLFFDFKS